MRRSLPAVVLTATLGVIGWQAGCTQSGQVTADRFPALYAQALCSSLQHCCSENNVSSDYAACTKGWEAAISSLISGPNATGNYNAQIATQCIDEVRAAEGVSCQPVPGSISDARSTCQAIFAGTVPLGAPCTSAAQCAQMDGSVVTCAVVPSAGDGGGSSSGGQLPLSDPSVSIQGVTISPLDVPVCVALPPPNAGTGGTPAPCTIDTQAGTDSCISSGAYCDSTTKACVPFAGQGQPCDPAVAASCQPGNYCVASGAAAGTCATAGPVGSPCTSPAMCDATGYCNSGTQTCAAIIQPGSPCTASTQCSVGVCDSTTHTCLTNAIATTAACNGNVTGQ
jgi:hypothetical protein